MKKRSFRCSFLNLNKVAFVEAKGDDHVMVDGIKLTSRVLRVNLEHPHRVFTFVATCGMELQEWANRIDDVLHRYWADKLKEMVLRLAMGVLKEHLIEHHRPGPISRMSPASLADWPIQEQKVLLEILGNIKGAIGVQLTDSLFIIPTKSVPGIFFATEENFESCQ